MVSASGWRDLKGTCKTYSWVWWWSSPTIKHSQQTQSISRDCIHINNVTLWRLWGEYCWMVNFFPLWMEMLYMQCHRGCSISHHFDNQQCVHIVNYDEHIYQMWWRRCHDWWQWWQWWWHVIAMDRKWQAGLFAWAKQAASGHDAATCNGNAKVKRNCVRYTIS